MTQRKKLIEVALPLEAINEASAREKSIRHGHPSTLHLWWARRPLAAARAVIFTSLVDDPDDPNAPPEFVQACRKLPKGKNATANDTPRQRLFDFIEQLVTWEATTDEKILTTARELIKLSTDGNPPPLLDPFAGGGSIPLEAQRLGLEAHASDLNPVAVMINKALIEIPPKFANQPPVNPRDRAKVGGKDAWKGASGLAADVRYYGEWMREKAWERIGHLYPECNGETVIAWLWARTVKSPNPAIDIQVPLVRNFWLSQKKNSKVWIEPEFDSSTGKLIYSIKRGKGQPPKGTVERGNGRCIVTNVPIPGDYIRKESREGRMGVELIAIATQSNTARNFYPPSPEHIKKAYSTQPDWFPSQPMNDETPDLVSGRGYGFYIWADLFTQRQLVMLSTFTQLVQDLHPIIIQDASKVNEPGSNSDAEEYSKAVVTYLAESVSKLTTFHNTLAYWRAKETKTSTGFGRQAIAMTWDFVETNPFANAGGDFLEIATNAAPRVIIEALPAMRSGSVYQRDAAATYDNGKRYIVSTDPPYYDNVSYADLSDYFYVWLRQALKSVYPTIFSTLLVPKNEELVAASHRFNNNKETANRHFETGLFKAFKNVFDVTSSDYPLTIFYAFKQTETRKKLDTSDARFITNTGWETMLEGLISSGYTINGTWPVKTEQTVALKTNLSSLASSIVLVCRPRPENAPFTSRREFVNSLRKELPAAIREMQSGNIAPVDLAQASIGPGMAVYSRYSQVLEADGSRLTVRAALQLINQVLDEFLAETEGDLDGDSRFAVSWFEQFGFKSGEFGVADVLARAKNTSVDGLVNAGVIESGVGKVRLLTWDELDPGWNPAEDKRATVWEGTHHLIERLNVHGEEGAALLLAKMSPDLAAAARQLAYRLYAICERKGWADHARDYNALVISWSTSAERAAEVKQTYQQRSLFE